MSLILNYYAEQRDSICISFDLPEIKNALIREALREDKDHRMLLKDANNTGKWELEEREDDNGNLHLAVIYTVTKKIEEEKSKNED